ncbi:MAG: polyprenyl diphosphate synthase [Patescibacteria group bacterium]|nr:polyprenyl diphosphate synthase [Patescibacteria group bacterium]
MKNIISKNIPRHLAIILDGNRRWARAHNLPTFEGHRQGFANIKTIATHAFDQGIEVMTVFAFSTENWKRSQEEVSYLMKLFKMVASKEFKFLTENNIKLQIAGDISAFDQELQKNLEKVLEETKNNSAGVFNVCLNYGGRQEIVRAVKNIIKSGLKPEEINEELIAKNLYTANLPNPDLIIRTSGEQRLSGFLTWQSVYSELYFVEKNWPDFSPSDLDEVLAVYAQRQRRFGGN